MAPTAFASWWTRCFAFVIDSALAWAAQFLGAFLGAVVAFAMVGLDAPQAISEDASGQGMAFGWFFWGAAAWFINLGVLQGLTGASLGKMLLGIRVVRGSDGAPLGLGKSLLRSVCYVVSSLPLYLGFLAPLWSARRQCWHDAIVGSVVTNKGATYPVEKVPELPVGASGLGSGPAVQVEASTSGESPRAA